MLSSVLADEDCRSRIGWHAARSVWRALVILIFTAAFVAPAQAAPAHFASLRSEKAYLREGPTFAHRILWIYRRKGYPLKVVGAFDVWRRVEDVDGTAGWMNSSMLSDRRTIVVTARQKVAVRAQPDAQARVVAWAEPGVVATLRACEASACEISAGGIEGWIEKKDIWGVDARETFQ